MALVRFALVPAAVLALAYAAPTAHAGTLTIKDTSYRTGVGGEFNVTGFDDFFLPPAAAVTNGITSGDVGDFKTFCMERNEFISLGASYTYTIDTRAFNGGISGQESPAGDPICEATAKLYYAFYSGQLDDYDYTTDGGRGDSGADLQHALWRLEGELNDSEWGTYIASHSRAEDWYDWAQTVTWSELGRDWAEDTIGNVRVVNLYNSAGVAKQSQLVVVPLPPAAFMGLALLAGLAGVKGLRKRKLARRLA
jgi:hypothetical protein